MKIPVILILILIYGITLCPADSPETNGGGTDHQIRIDKEEEVPGVVFNHFYRELPLDIPLILDINAGRFTFHLEKLFKEKLVKDGYSLYETAPENSLVIRLNYDEETRRRSSGFFLFRKEFLEDTYYFSYQLTKTPEGEILDFENLTLTNVTVQERSNMKWYDPILISAIIGTLAYLFYFGGN